MIYWRKYRGALLPIYPPHLMQISKKQSANSLKELGGFFARWTSNWDCGYETEWWYCIKDDKISLTDLSPKQRYRINRGLKNCDVSCLQIINDVILNEIYDCANEALLEYPIEYRPQISKVVYLKELKDQFKKGDIWISRDFETGIISGYAYCSTLYNTVNLVVVKTRPSYKKKEVNAVLAYKICEYYLNKKGYLYVCDGERNIVHQTNYQDFLVRNLKFRYAYCNLNIVYNPWIKLIVSMLYPFRNLMKKLPGSMIYNISCTLKFEEIARSFRK